MHRLPRPSRALLVSLVALFFALGGTAFAVGSKVAPQPRCATGAIRGIAVVTGGTIDLSTLPGTFTSQPAALSYHWSCTSGQILIRKPPGVQGVEIKFVGNPATVAIVSSAASGTPNGGSVSRQSDGSFQVVMGGANTGVPGPWQAQWNVPFVIVLL
jgi:hypothetical protein